MKSPLSQQDFSFLYKKKKKLAENFAETKIFHTFALAKTKRGVAQLVAFLVWDQAVAGSSPVTPTRKGKSNKAFLFCFTTILQVSC